MNLNEQKKKWWNGLRNAATGEITTLELETEVLVDGYGIPRSLAKNSLDQLTPANEKQLIVMNHMYNMVHDWKGTPSTMIVTGGNGTGKSMLGAALVHTLAIEDALINGLHISSRFTDEASLTMRLSGFDTSGTFDLFARKIAVLVIDEFAMTQWSPADKKKIEQYLGVRYGNNLKTIIFTNRTPDELFGTGGQEAILSSQLRSRYGSGYMVDMSGVDYRRNPEALKRAIESGGHSEDWLF